MTRQSRCGVNLQGKVANRLVAISKSIPEKFPVATSQVEEDATPNPEQNRRKAGASSPWHSSFNSHDTPFPRKVMAWLFVLGLLLLVAPNLLIQVLPGLTAAVIGHPRTDVQIPEFAMLQFAEALPC